MIPSVRLRLQHVKHDIERRTRCLLQ